MSLEIPSAAQGPVERAFVCRLRKGSLVHTVYRAISGPPRLEIEPAPTWPLVGIDRLEMREAFDDTVFFVDCVPDPTQNSVALDGIDTLVIQVPVRCLLTYEGALTVHCTIRATPGCPSRGR